MYLTCYVLIVFLLRITRTPAALFLRGLTLLLASKSKTCNAAFPNMYLTCPRLARCSDFPNDSCAQLSYDGPYTVSCVALCLQAKALYDDVISRSYSCAVWERKLKDSRKIRCVATGDQHEWRINFLSSNFLRKSLRQTNWSSLSLILPIIHTVLGL